MQPVLKRDLFTEWVRKWKIGAGMNDNPRAVQFLEEEIAKPPTAWRTPERIEGMKQTVELLKAGLYSGFDGTVGDGWIPIIDRLAEDLVRMGWDRDLHQIKEKFGTLRFYVGHATEEMMQRIAQAEDESGVTCEECGKPGETKGPGWIKTLCEDCRRARYQQQGREV